MRYFVYFSYDGSNYHGWQIQPNAISVQAVFQEALGTLHQEKVEVVAAGRTDTGVHAEMMVAHFDTVLQWEVRSFIHRINSLLPKDIGVKHIVQVKNDSHARFDAINRSYRYLICKPKNPFLFNRAYQLNHQLDVDAMNRAAAHLIREADFSSFSKSHTQTFTNICTISAAKWTWEGDVLVFTITANRFLRNMVRAIVGTLIKVGEGKRKEESISRLIQAKDRSLSGSSVFAGGLYLSEINYPESIFEIG